MVTDGINYPYWEEDGLWYWMRQPMTNTKTKSVSKKPKRGRKRQSPVIRFYHLNIQTQFYETD